MRVIKCALVVAISMASLSMSSPFFSRSLKISLAGWCSNPQRFKELLSRIHDIDRPGLDGQPLLHSMIRAHSQEDFKLNYLEYRNRAGLFDMNLKNSCGETALNYVFKRNDDGIKTRTIMGNFKYAANVPDCMGGIPLHYASQTGVIDLEHFKKLVSWTADVNRRDDLGIAAIHYAIMFGRLEFVEVLITHHAKVNLPDLNGMTAMHYAARFEYLKIIETLIARGGDVKVSDNNGLTPLHCAVKSRNIETIMLLLRYGAEINAQTVTGLTVLHLAVLIGDLDIVECLCAHGADYDIVDALGDNALTLAQSKFNTSIVAYLQHLANTQKSPRPRLPKNIYGLRL